MAWNCQAARLLFQLESWFKQQAPGEWVPPTVEPAREQSIKCVHSRNEHTDDQKRRYPLVNSVLIFGRRRLAAFAGLLVSGCLLLSQPAAGQDILISGIEIGQDGSAVQIGAAIEAVEGRQDLDAETRASVIAFLRVAETQLESKRSADAMAEQYSGSLDTAPAEADALRAQLLGQSPESVTIESLGIDDSSPLAELQQRLAKETAELYAVDSELAELNSQVETQIGRPAVARERIAQLQRTREELATNADGSVVIGEEQILTDARKLAAQSRRAAAGSDINRLEQELLSYAVRLDLLRVKRDVAARSQVTLQQRADMLRTLVSDLQQAAETRAKEAAIDAELAAADKHPVVRSLAEYNASLAVNLPSGAADIEEAKAQLAEITTKTRSIERRLARSRQFIAIGGNSRITGRLLIEERRSLPQVGRYRPKDAEIAEAGLALMFVQEQRRGLAPLDDRAQELMADADLEALGEAEIATIASEVQLLLRSRADLLLRMENSYRNYLQVLGDLDAAQDRLLESAGEYEEFLNQSLLWIPSAPIAFKSSWSDVSEAAKWAVSVDAWRGAFAVLGKSLRANYASALAFVLLLGLLLLVRPPLNATYASMSLRIGKLSTDNIGLTIGSLAIALAKALPVPLIIAGTAWFLYKAPQATAFSDTFASGLSATAFFLLNTLLLRTLSEPGGVFVTHFAWNPANTLLIRRQLGRLTFFATPLVFTTVFMFVSEGATGNSNLGRFLFVPLMLVLAFVIHPLVHPGTGLAASYYKQRPQSWVSKFQWVWYAVAVGLPLLLAVISLLGNVYTSTKLASLFVDSVWVAFGLIIINMVVLRWLALSRRKLELKILLQEREAQKAEKETAAQNNAEGDAPAITAEPLDLDAVDQQSRNLLRAGLVFAAAIAGWQIWSEIFPAFTVLEGVSLWSRSVVVDGVETFTRVTLADLLLAFFVVVVAAIASKNLPGFMEIALPQRLNVEPGSRYAINTLVRYFIIMVGTVAVLNIIGWNWSRIQWLVAALSVGLGFGLQEIVANFVSGLVILFERPVRVGDTVTVGQLTGTVSRIRIRATTITDWDRKEIIVPNKSFITEQVVNWTLTDSITRVVIPVGVDYGSEVGLVHKVISDALPTLPLVLDEPAPRVYFSGFGDSSLDFTLHVYLRQLGDRMPLIHEVHNAILKELRGHGIQIPFPQRDLHIRTMVDPPDTNENSNQ